MSLRRKPDFEESERAACLPAEWDARCGDNFALKRRFLEHLETANPGDRRYVVFRDAHNAVDSILVVERVPKCNLLMFTPWNWHADATFVHAPLSVARPGCVIGRATRFRVERFLQSLGGFVVALNLAPEVALPGFAAGWTCSDIRLSIRWTSLSGYLDSLRSPYRRRLKTALERGARLHFRMLEDDRGFDARLYRQYEAVHARSRIGIEKLRPSFFSPAMSRILVCERRGRPLGFLQMIENGEELVFAFVGLDYEWNRTCDVYWNLLLRMLEYGMEHGFRRIDLGQTAEEAKLRLGGEFRPLRAFIRHSHPLLNGVLRPAGRAISYRQPELHFRVFREHRAS